MPGADDRAAADRFARQVAPTLVTVARRAVDLAELEEGDAVLDLGTATGLVAFLAAEKAGRDGTVIGVDPSSGMLAVAQERSEAVGYSHLRWEQSDGIHLGFADESFDAVLCVQALSAFAEPYTALEEAKRVLVAGGHLVVTTWGPRSGNEWHALLEDALRSAAPRLSRPPALPLSQPGNLEVVLQALGFEQIEVARAPDRMRLDGLSAFWEWASAMRPWAAVVDSLPADAQRRLREQLASALRHRAHDEELVLRREIVYARAVAPEPE
jgi:SAM-dependent methyltransferase